MAFDAITTVSTLESALAPVDALVEECVVECTPTGWRIDAVDPANVGQVRLDLASRAFESYETHSDGERVGVPLDRLLDVVALGDSGALVHLTLDIDRNVLTVQVGGRTQYDLALVDPDSVRDPPNFPDLGLPVRATLTGADLAHAVAAAGLANDKVSVETNTDLERITFAATGDTDTVETVYHEDDLLAGVVTDTVASMVSLDYLEDVTGPVDDDHDVDLGVGDSMPITLAYERVEGHCEVEHRLAPRIKDGGGS